jgi:fructosamine-3-kinase
MKPEVPEVLGELAQLLVRNADPSVHPADRASDLGMSAMLLGYALESWDGRAHMLVEENRAFHALLQRGGSHAPVPVPPAEDNLRLSALTAENQRLAQALIALHAAVENDPAAADLNEAIWAELRASTERRRWSTSVV